MESRTIGADEIAEALGMSRAYAYKLIRRLNKEMEERGCITVPRRVSRTHFEMLYWYGVREGELLALKPRRFDFERGTLTVAESYQRIDGQDVLTDPKTPKSKRVIAMPGFYAEEMEAFLSALGLDPDKRIFPVTKHFLSHEMARGSKAAGLEPICVHDLRHSHVSLLIDMGFTALAIADRMGNEAADVTYRYAHLFPSVQADMARALDGARREN